MKTLLLIWKKLAVLILFLGLSSSFLFGAAITNIAAGNWSNPATWPATTRTGTITSILTSAVVTGVGTSFLTEVTVGATITKASGGGAGNVIGVVASIESNTQFTLQANASYAYAGIAYKVSGIPLSTDDVTIGGGLAVIVDGGTFYCKTLTTTAGLTYGTSNGTNVPGNLVVNGIVTLNAAVGTTTGTDNIINSLTCWGFISNNKPFDFYNSATSATNVFINFHDALPDYYTTYPGGQFYNLTLGDGSATQYNSFAIKAATTIYGNVVCDYKSKLYLQAGNATCYGNITVKTEGTLQVDATYTLSMANTKTIALQGGYLNLYGTGAAARATITGITGTDYYTITGDANSGIRAKYYGLTNLDCSASAGLTHSGFIDYTDNLNNGTFTSGKAGAYAYMDLTDANLGSSVTIPGCVFNAGPTYNVKRTSGNGSITFSTYSGVLASSGAVGEANDIDNANPGDFVLWQAQTIYYTRVASGNWSDVTTWSTGGCGGVAAAAIPTSVDVVYICSGHTVTVNGNYSCLSLKFHTSSVASALVINSPNTLTVGSDISIVSLAANSTSATFSGTGTLTMQYLDIGIGNPTLTATPLTTSITSTISNLNIIGGIYLVSSYNATGPRYNTPIFTLTSGTLSLYGKISTRNINAANSCSFILGTSSPVLKLYDATSLNLNMGVIGSSTVTLNGTGSTVNYAKTTGGQTILNYTYNNLVFSNTSGTDAATANITMNGDLTTTTGGTVDLSTYTLGGTVNTITNNGTIKTSNTSAAPIPTNKTWGGTGTVEYAASGTQTVVKGTYYNLTTSGNNTKTLENAITVSNHLTIGTSTTLDVSASNYTITLGGNLLNYGTFTRRSGNFIFNKTTGAQYITGVTDFYDLEIAKNSSNEVLLNDNINVYRYLNFSSPGFLNLKFNTLTLKNWSDGNIPTLETDRYVVLNSGVFVIENVGNGVTAQFPVGLATSNVFFARVDVTNHDATTNFSYSALYNI